MSSDATTHLHDSDGRLTTWLRIMIVIVAFVVVDMLVGSVGLLFGSLAAQFAVSGAATGLALIGLFALVVRRLDRRRPQAYGLQIDRTWWLDLAAGMVIGLSIPAIAFAGMVAGGWLQVTDVLSSGTREGVWTGIVAAAIYYLGVGIYEELLFRGYVMSNAAEKLAMNRPVGRSVLGAVAISTLVFAALHPAILTSPAPAALVGLFFVLMGAILGLAYAYTGRLALPIGIHVAVNLAGNRIFSLGVASEQADEAAMVFRTTVQGPGWITGEGGAGMVLATMIGGLLVWAWIRACHGPVAIDPTVARTSTEPALDGSVP